MATQTTTQQAPLAADLTDDQLLLFGEEEEVIGSLTFKPPIEILPDTQRTAELKKRKLELLRKRREDQENERKRKEQEEAQRRLKEQEMKKLKQEAERKKKEEERKRREEEEQRKSMEGGLDQLLGQLASNTSSPQVAVTGIELGSVRLRLLAQALENNTSCIHIDLSRKGLNDEDGVFLAAILKKNHCLEVLDMEGNQLGPKTAAAFAEACMENRNLRSLNMKANNLTAGGSDQSGVMAFGQVIAREFQRLHTLNLANNALNDSAGAEFAAAIQTCGSVINLDLSENPEIDSKNLRAVDGKIDGNREEASQMRRNERRERFAMFNEEFKTRQFLMHVEARRLEIEAFEERKLDRLHKRLAEWGAVSQKETDELNEKMADLMQDYEDRKAARKGKKGKKKK